MLKTKIDYICKTWGIDRLRYEL
uniref:Uncharacterized protein n=1 Tax=Anguilla anguilla TaxID=7936 RepID=A0A0E9QJU2_ANGAN